MCDAEAVCGWCGNLSSFLIPCSVKMINENLHLSEQRMHSLCKIWDQYIATVFCRQGLPSFMFWRESLFVWNQESARSEKKEAARSEVLKPWIWWRFKTDLFSALTSDQHQHSVRLGDTDMFYGQPWLKVACLWLSFAYTTLDRVFVVGLLVVVFFFFSVIIFYYQHKKKRKYNIPPGWMFLQCFQLEIQALCLKG